MTRDQIIEKVARALCVAAGDDPDKLEPGNSPPYLSGADGIGVVCADGTTSKGEEGFFVWRLYGEQATIAVAVAMAIDNAEIERLRAENKQLRALLEEAASDLTDWTMFWKISDALGWERPHG